MFRIVLKFKRTFSLWPILSFSYLDDEQRTLCSEREKLNSFCKTIKTDEFFERSKQKKSNVSHGSLPTYGDYLKLGDSQTVEQTQQ